MYKSIVFRLFLIASSSPLLLSLFFSCLSWEEAKEEPLHYIYIHYISIIMTIGIAVAGVRYPKIITEYITCIITASDSRHPISLFYGGKRKYMSGFLGLGSIHVPFFHS